MPIVTLKPAHPQGQSAWLDQVLPTQNFSGTSFPYIEVGSQAAGIPGQRARSLFRIDTSPLGTGIVVNSTKIRLYTDFSSGGIRQVDIHRVLRGWVEGEATWNNYSTGNAWTSGGAFGIGDVDFTISGQAFPGNTPPLGYVEFTGAVLATNVQDWANLVKTNNGWLIKLESSIEGVTLQKEYLGSGVGGLDAGNRPEVVVDFDEAPSGVYLPNPLANRLAKSPFSMRPY